MEILEIRKSGDRVGIKYANTDTRWIVIRFSEGFGPGMEWKFDHELKDWPIVYSKEN